MKRNYKTSKKNRTNYIYYSADGTKITISPGENDVSEAEIELLHSIDDEEVNSKRQYDYYVIIYLDAYHDGENESASYRNKYFADDNEIPEDVLIAKENEQQHKSFLKKFDAVMESLLPQQKELFKKVYVDKRTNIDIAAEEGVSEAAIRNRLKKMHKKFKKFS